MCLCLSLATVNGTIPKAIHPAPLPPCPLTGKPGHHIKPPCPNLDLSAKQDGELITTTITYVCWFDLTTLCMSIADIIPAKR